MGAHNAYGDICYISLISWCEYLMEIRAPCMFLYLCGESGDKSPPPTALAFPTSDDTVVFYILHEFSGCLGSGLQISGADIIVLNREETWVVLVISQTR